MTSMLLAPSIAEVLRGQRDQRPRRDETSAPGLRALLDDRLFEVLGAARPASPWTMSAGDLRGHGTSTPLSTAPWHRLRGLLVSTIVRLLVVGVELGDPFDDAVRAWRAQHPSHDLLGELERADAEQVARLRSDVRAHADVLIRHLGVVPASWRPRTAVRTAYLLQGGQVVVRDVVDLQVGNPHAAETNVALLDVTTAPLGDDAERALRYHALTTTLRTSVVPRYSALFSTATGELWCREVDHELLVRSVDDVAEALARRMVSC